MPTNENPPTECEEPTTDIELLLDPTAKMHAGYIAFVEEMRGRRYEIAQLYNAWEWFKKGWLCRGR